jgi:hypothetical protein
MLSKLRPTHVTSRLIASHPPLDVLRTASPYGGLNPGAAQVDLRLTATAQKEIRIEVLLGFATVYQNRLNLHFPNAEPVEYTHRLDLLPGSYRLMFTVDGTTYAYPLELQDKPVMGEIMRADAAQDVPGRQTPFAFTGRQIALNSEGRMALVSVPRKENVTWIVREGTQAVWRETREAEGIATVELPNLSPGAYRLEANTSDETRRADIAIAGAVGAPPNTAPPNTALVSFNANLAPARRLAFLGHQWLLRGDFTRARQCLAASLAAGDTREARIELARAEAMSGDLDGARERVRGILAANPKDFEALAVFAYIETKFQDFPVAAELYRQALAVQDSPELRMALAKLPGQ